MIAGIGVDVVELARFERAATRTPRLLDRLFAESERVVEGRQLSLRSLAARFAAKEALIKALGDSDGVSWHDMPIVSDALGNPEFALCGGAAEVARGKGIDSVHLSLSHDGGIAIAYVITESHGEAAR